MRLSLRIATILMACLLSMAASAAEPDCLEQSSSCISPSPTPSTSANSLQSFQSTLKAGSDDSRHHLSRESLGYTVCSRARNTTALSTDLSRRSIASGPISVIVADGFDALQFAVSLRTEIETQAYRSFFPASMDGTAAQLKLPPNVTGTTIHRTARHVLITAKALVPGLKRIAVVGDPLRGADLSTSLQERSFRQSTRTWNSSISRACR